ncbi:MAG: hypothetical protein JWL84_1105 [Rhodospirillales bacterium]|jgi:hypothetical protein|nr:hypothetical protein [Rhodospirillales bacterium]
MPQRKRVLFLATRDPRGRATGRKMALRTIIRSCAEIGFDVHVAVFGDAEPGDGHLPLPAAHFTFLARAGLWRALVNLLSRGLRGRLSLNECLYFSPGSLARLKEVAAEIAPDVVIADMVRTASYAMGLDQPWVLDFDDRLSARYEDWSRKTEAQDILGYLQRSRPRLVTKLVGWLRVPILRFESRLLRRRELELAHVAAACTMVNPGEARALSAETGRRVWCAPMSVSVPRRPARESAPLNPTPVFVGGIDYAPNFEAVAFFKDQLGPGLKARSDLPSTLDVIGFCTSEHRDRLDGGHVRLLGYAPDLYRRLAEYSIFVAPVLSGTGIKTKVVEALLMGLIVVSTPAGLAGLDLGHRTHCYVFETARDLADCLREILGDPTAATTVADNGRHYAERNFAPDVLRERWREILDFTLSQNAA